jgi:SAM-dependent methyltransferase
MTASVFHPLALPLTRDEAARQDFVSQLRAHLLNAMAGGLRQRWAERVAPALPAPPASGEEVARAMAGQPYLAFYTAARVHAQRMVWASVEGQVAREGARLEAMGEDGPATLALDPSLDMPPTVTRDVHLMPGSYAGGEGAAAGAMYEHGLGVFSFGLMGRRLDDIGQSITLWLHARHPEFRPAAILDLGCAVGHQTLPWAEAYPEARVTGLDVAAPCLRYARKRANALGIAAHFLQADARAVPLPDASQDLVFSSMFLHELPEADIRAVYAECRRLLRPGGLMLHYELPPNKPPMDPFDQFYLDWDATFNCEPHYKAYRDLDPHELARSAGFAPERVFDAVVPSLAWYGPEAARAGAALGEDGIGRLADGVKWYVHGAWA